MRLRRARNFTYTMYVHFAGMLYDLYKDRNFAVRYQSLDEAIYHEDVDSRQELIEKLSHRFSTYSEISDSELLELANRYRSEKQANYLGRFIANDPIDW